MYIQTSESSILNLLKLKETSTTYFYQLYYLYIKSHLFLAFYINSFLCYISSKCLFVFWTKDINFSCLVVSGVIIN